MIALQNASDGWKVDALVLRRGEQFHAGAAKRHTLGFVSQPLTLARITIEQHPCSQHFKAVASACVQLDHSIAALIRSIACSPLRPPSTLDEAKTVRMNGSVAQGRRSGGDTVDQPCGRDDTKTGSNQSFERPRQPELGLPDVQVDLDDLIPWIGSDVHLNELRTLKSQGRVAEYILDADPVFNCVDQGPA